MAKDSVALLVFDGFADWEPALATAGLRENFGVAVATYGLTDQPVVSMGGLRVLPDAPLAALDPSAHRLLILPGGEMWNEAAVPAVSELVRAITASGGAVAAICAA